MVVPHPQKLAHRRKPDHPTFQNTPVESMRMTDDGFALFLTSSTIGLIGHTRVPRQTWFDFD